VLYRSYYYIFLGLYTHLIMYVYIFYTVLSSYFISMDMAHGLHPNYEERYDTNNAPQLNSGIVIKDNVNMRYATSYDSRYILKDIGAKACIPLQSFSVRNDCACGSTIGPM
jgi:aspartyl aminopeptidase